MKLAYATIGLDQGNPIYAKNLCGHYILKSFKNNGIDFEVFHYNVETIRYFFAIHKLYYQYIAKKNYMLTYNTQILKMAAKRISKRINFSDVDFVFSFGSLSVAFLETDKPIFFLADATLQNVIDYYPEYTNLHPVMIKNIKEIEYNAFQRSRKIFFPGEWAANSAVVDYNVPPEKVAIIPLGANIDRTPSWDEIDSIINKRKLSELNLVLVGKDWYRKGADRAIEFHNLLISLGINSHLTIIGMTPPNKISADGVTIISFLDKSRPEEAEQFSRIMEQAHFFLFPTRSDAYPHVICEANAFGVPVVANHTGGIPSIIVPNQNGFLVNFDSPSEVEQVTKTVVDYHRNFERYFQLAKSSFLEYHKRLNWDVTIKLLLEHIKASI